MKVPVEHKGLAESIQSLIDATVAAAESSRGGRAVDYAETEREIAEQTAAVERAAHAEVLCALDVDAPRVRVRGVLLNRVGRAPCAYSTMAGAAVVERTVYREAGVRKGPILDPIAVRTGAYGVDGGHDPRVFGGVARHRLGPGQTSLRDAKWQRCSPQKSQANRSLR